MGNAIDFDAQTGSFTEGETLYDEDGETATIFAISDAGTTGTLFLADITGGFGNNKIIFESALGSELVTGTDSDMSGANNWVGPNLGTFDINTTVADKMYMLGDGGNDQSNLITTTVVGEIYRSVLKARLNAGASTTIRVGSAGGTAPEYFNMIPTGTEVTYTGYFIGGITTFQIGLYTIGFNGIAFEIDDVSVKQVTNAALANGTVYYKTPPSVHNFTAKPIAFNFDAKPITFNFVAKTGL